jgi:hypothetical protein
MEALVFVVTDPLPVATTNTPVATTNTPVATTNTLGLHRTGPRPWSGTPHCRRKSQRRALKMPPLGKNFSLFRRRVRNNWNVVRSKSFPNNRTCRVSVTESSPLTVWWASKYRAFHPTLLHQIERQLLRDGSDINDLGKKTWENLLDISRAQPTNDHGHHLQRVFGRSGKKWLKVNLMICERAITTRIEDLILQEPGEIKIRRCPVQITTTGCNFGGCRFWFLCPVRGRRCAILYPVLCRKCQNGRYEMESKRPSAAVRDHRGEWPARSPDLPREIVPTRLLRHL